MSIFFNSFLLVIIAYGLAACNASNISETTPSKLAVTVAPPTKLPALARTLTTEVACVAKGGRWQKVGRLQALSCVLSASDAGQACTDSRQCQVSCIVPNRDTAPGAVVNGQCHDTTNEFGCRARVSNGKAEPTLCID